MSEWHVMRRRPTTISGLAVLVVVATVGLALATAIAAQPVPTADLAIVSNTASAKAREGRRRGHVHDRRHEQRPRRCRLQRHVVV